MNDTFLIGCGDHISTIPLQHTYIDQPAATGPFAGITPLNQSIMEANSARTQTLLDLGAKVMIVDMSGYTPLHLACFLSNFRAVDILLRHNHQPAVIEYQNTIGHTPLHTAALKNSIQSIQLLIDHRADVESRSPSGETPLTLAASMSNSEAVRVLIQQKADVNSITQEGITPMMSAIFGQASKHCTDLLLEAGAERVNFQKRQIWLPYLKMLLIFPEKAKAHRLGKNPICREALSALMMAHSLKFEFELSLAGENFSMGRGNRPGSRLFMLRCLEAFHARYPKILSSAEFNNIRESLSQSDRGSSNLASALLEKIQQPNSVVLIPTGYYNHSIEICIIRDYLVINNKGDVSEQPGEIFLIDRTRFDIQQIEALLKTDKPAGDYETWRKNLSTTLNAQKDPFALYIESIYPLCWDQLTNNCSWESLETSVFFNLAISRLYKQFCPSQEPEDKFAQQVGHIFVHWLRFTQLQTVENYLKRIYRSQIPANNQLAAIVLQQLEEIENWYGMEKQVISLKKHLMSV